MYAYRRMTPDQRRTVVIDRIARGVPWHKPAHPRAPEGWYLITAACYEHRLHFRRPAELTALQQRLCAAFAEAGAACGAWVVMPNHYHALLQINDFKSFGKAIGKVHGRSSRYANERDGVCERQVWFKYSDRGIRSERHYWTTVHYIVHNPVKHGFALQVDAWPWSSFHDLASTHGPTWLEDLQREYPLRDYGKSWDSFTIAPNP